MEEVEEAAGRFTTRGFFHFLLLDFSILFRSFSDTFDIVSYQRSLGKTSDLTQKAEVWELDNAARRWMMIDEVFCFNPAVLFGSAINKQPRSAPAGEESTCTRGGGKG